MFGQFRVCLFRTHTMTVEDQYIKKNESGFLGSLRDVTVKCLLFDVYLLCINFLYELELFPSNSGT